MNMQDNQTLGPTTYPKRHLFRRRGQPDPIGTAIQSSSSPSAAWPGRRNVVIDSPFPQTVIAANRSAAIIRDRFATRLLGLPIADRRAARDRCLPPHFDYGFPELIIDRYAFAGIEMALWDLQGKRREQPLFRLLGGPARERAEKTISVDALVRIAKALRVPLRELVRDL